MNKGIIIIGSANSNGETRKIVSYIENKTSFPVVDLNGMDISEFDYEFQNRGDDFHPLMTRIVDNYELIIFATPVYWYTMSGTMKTFFDRLSDCLKIEKETGRKLRGMKMAVVSCGSDKELKDGFHMPFIETANYLGMKYISDVHCWLDNGDLPNSVELKLDTFMKEISA
ncbi:MAG: multimeric flavodoxin WrbA [Flavobacteriaceae bacterium]|jgi:multimeric flavodoxin WrbA